MSGDESDGAASAPTERFAIGISFGNSNSSIAYTSGVRISDTVAREAAFLRTDSHCP